MAAYRDYLEFELELTRDLSSALAPDGPRYIASARSPAGEAEASFQLPFRPEEAETTLLRVENALLRAASRLRRSTNPDEEMLRDFGERLFHAVFAAEIRTKYAASKERADAEERGLRIRLIVRARELATIPWELLCEPEAAGFVALSSKNPFVRYLRARSAAKPVAVEWPLRVLGVGSSPSDYKSLNIELERENLRQALVGLGQHVDLTWLERADRDSLRRRLLEPWHVLHFAGHGGFDASNGEGYIVLESPSGRAEKLSAAKLGMLLADQSALRLVVLSACEGAREDVREGVSSTAARLVELGVPAVVGMQYPVSDDAAIEFSRVLYEALVQGFPIDAAVAWARKSLCLGNSFEWITPIVFMRAPDGLLFRFCNESLLPGRQLIQPTSSSPSARVTTPARSERIGADTQTPSVKRRSRWRALGMAAGALLALGLSGSIFSAIRWKPDTLFHSSKPEVNSAIHTLPESESGRPLAPPETESVPETSDDSNQPKAKSRVAIAPRLGPRGGEGTNVAASALFHVKAVKSGLEKDEMKRPRTIDNPSGPEEMSCKDRNERANKCALRGVARDLADRAVEDREADDNCAEQIKKAYSLCGWRPALGTVPTRDAHAGKPPLR